MAHDQVEVQEPEHEKVNRPPLDGKRVAVVMTDGVEQVEYTGPRSFLEQQGAQVILISPKGVGAAVQGMNHDDKGDMFPVEMNIQDAHPNDFDADEELAALVIDLADEVRRLRARLRALGIRDR